MWLQKSNAGGDEKLKINFMLPKAIILCFCIASVEYFQNAFRPSIMLFTLIIIVLHVLCSNVHNTYHDPGFNISCNVVRSIVIRNLHAKISISFQTCKYIIVPCSIKF